MSYLWAVNSQGKVFTLSTSSDCWSELENNGIDFKRISVHEFFTWGIGGDHQIYIYVPTKDIPIRCQVVTYENERWNPLHGFSSKLLPTDRPHWSSKDGLVHLPQESFDLPSKSWEWEEEWYVEDNLEGQPLEPEGWTYAIDFPAKYGPSKTWNSLVRRRKWLRYRRYCATSRWSLIPSIHEDPVLEPFIDVSVGGTEIPGGEQDNFTVWAVTVMGKVVFRHGVTTSSPEGDHWVLVETPEQCDASQISVGSTGLVWAATWGGNALVRVGVTRENVIGADWVIVNPPSEEDKLTQITVGTNVVWAISKDNKVWFRKGINGTYSGENEKDATGSGWIEMYGSLTMVSVGQDDQVFSISSNGHSMLLRTSVNTSELCGRTWKAIEAPVKGFRRASSLSSIDSSSSSHKDSLYSSENCLSSKKSSQDSFNSNTATLKRDKSISISGINIETPEKLNRRARFSVGSHSDRSVENVRFDTLNNRTSSYSSLNLGSDAGDVPDMWQSSMDVGLDHTNVLWLWISSSGCLINSEALPHWFCEGSSVNYTAVDEPWYNDILQQFKKRYNHEAKNFSYPRAVEKSSWVKSGTCKWYKSHHWVSCLIELVQQGEFSGERSTLTFHHKKDQVVIPLNNITCVACLPDWNKMILVIHTAKRTLKGQPYKFSFSSHDDLEDWLATLNSSTRRVNNISFTPEKTSLWSLTMNGDVFVHNPSSSVDLIQPSDMHWSLLGGGHLRIVETCPEGVTWGLGYNCVAWAYTRGFGGGPYHGVPGCNVSVGPMSDVRCLYIYENQRWNPLSGFTAKGLPTDRYMWSDQTGRVKCTKDNTNLPSPHWQWITEWFIDYKTPGGVDNEGWQYATDFPRSYHGYKRFTDYVRRRRWCRKCKLMTSGPWRQLGTTPLIDFSFQMDQSSDEQGTVPVWAIAINGDVLYRVGVSEDCPTGLTWIHIPAEKSFRSISVGSDGAVWAVASDGSAQLRYGVSQKTPTGQYWCHVEAPQMGCPLRQISAGKTSVLAVDESNRLWSRQEIVAVFKEGTHWKLVSENVKQVSVGPMDQIWCVMTNFDASSGSVSGVVCRRAGIREDNKCGMEWQQGIGGCWSHISVRGCIFSEDDCRSIILI